MPLSALHTHARQPTSRSISLAKDYALVLASVAATTLVRALTTPFFGTHVVFILYFPALVASAWIRGWGGGLVALLVSALAADYFFVTPAHSLLLKSHTDRISLFVFLLVGLSVSALGSAQRQARRQAQSAAEAARRSEQAFQESEERLRLALEGGGLGTWHWDLATGAVDWPPRTKALFGLPPDASIERTRHLAILHPDDRPRVAAALQAAIQGGPPYDEEYRAVWPDGSVHWIASRGRVYSDGRGEAVRMEGIVEDITARRELADRDRTIAAQLQAALLPAPPARMPGLALYSHYEAALKEAGVGGDFCDVFGLGNGCTALVVGDLAGKGLAAAAQVATVRNMVRYAVFRSRTLAGAITNLNAVLVEQELLSGFSTLFVGTFDVVARTLTYVNCGQEPGLVRRDGMGTVEELPPTGPVLGTFDGAAYEECTVSLAAGDVVALFTDGLTEVGPSRLALIGVEGVAALLAQPPDQEAEAACQTAEAVGMRLIGGVDAAARGGVMRDDVCLLVAVVT